ncbi:MAG TPA: metallophosphoesterase family protein [Candidatus Acidoferrales bacterium]|nr:metallophosphoesterase family protein [Candidatus Acidoferrales bacterium]
MRYLVLSDIHANLTALEASLAAAEGQWEKAVCLGDVVGYGPDPNEVIDRIRGISAMTIRGNHDKVGCGLTDADDFNPIARAAALWTREQLRPDNREYLEKLPTGPAPFNGMSLVHGAIRDEDEYVVAPAQALDSLLDAPSPVTFFGHTHLQGGFALGPDNQVQTLRFRPADGEKVVKFQLQKGTSYLLNPGSVGQPRDGDPRAGFAIADAQKGEVEFWRVSYEVESVQRRMEKAGLPEPLILRLSFGR